MKPLDLPSHLIVFDGTCVLCNNGMKFILRMDRHEKFQFCTAQSDIGQGLYKAYGLDPSDLDTFMVLIDGVLYEKLDGIIAINSALGWPWKVFSVAKILPKGLKDWLYDRLAKNRYAMFGQYDTCMIPTPEVRNRFIDSTLQ